MKPSTADLGERILSILAPGASRDLLDALTRSDEDRTTLIARLHLRADGEWLAELLMDVESDPDDLVRLRLIDAERVRGGHSDAG